MLFRSKGRKIYTSLKKLGEKGCREKESYNKILKKIHKSQQKIELNVTWNLVYNCITPMNYVIRREMFCEEDKFEEEICKTAKNGIAMMNNIKKCIDILLPLVEETVCNIE